MSCIKFVLERDYTNLNVFNGNKGEKFNSRLRSRCESVFQLECQKSGDNLIDSAPVMVENEYRDLCKHAFTLNSSSGVEDRCTFVLHYHCIGRYQEVSKLILEDIVYNPSTLQTSMVIRFNRSKTAKINHICVVLHSSDWIICPFHALATMLITNPVASNKV